MFFLHLFGRKWLLATLLVLVGTAVCIRLGIWQLDRLEQRQAFNAHYLQVIALPPLDLNGAGGEDLAGMEYRRVTVTGRYDFEHQVALRNRYYKTDNANQPGVHLVTPLILQDGTAVLVERGWIPSAGNPSPEDWRTYDQPGEVTVQGILRLGQAAPEVGGVPDPTLMPGQTGLDYWNLINVERIATQLPYPVLPAYVQPDPQARSEPPYPYQPEIEISEGPHMGYALQWFTFATILFIGYPFYVRKQNELETQQ